MQLCVCARFVTTLFVLDVYHNLCHCVRLPTSVYNYIYTSSTVQVM